MKFPYALAIAACLAVTCATAQTARTDKLSPLVRKAAAHAHAQRLAPATSSPRITAFMSIDPASADSILRANGCIVYDRSDDIFIVSAPTNRIATLSALPEVRRMEASSPCRPAMDTTATIVNAMAAYDGKALPQAFTGRGVVVGVMDVGFDLTHPNFFDSTATEYRIGAFWDQLDTDTTGSGFPVGRDYKGRGELLRKKHSTDGLIQTHGTHTLGISAGSGYNSPYRGMAYESDICLVSNAVTSDLPLIDSADVYKYTSATDALGFKYIFDYATGRGLPCVASFSEGATPTYGSEDSLYSRYIERLTGPGRIIVASAGNESTATRFVMKPAGKPEAGSFLYTTESEAGFFVEADGPFALRLLSYGSTNPDTMEVSSSQLASGQSCTTEARLFGGACKCTATTEWWPSGFAFGDTIYHVVLSFDKPLKDIGPLAVAVSGAETEASLRCYQPAFFANALADQAWADAETTHNVNAPGCFPSIITVGATIHRTGFTNYLGQYFDYSQPGRNDGVRSWYSSVGPTMDGRLKPDVTAPGDNVVSSYSSYYEEANPEAGDIRSDVAHFAFNGRTYAWNSNTGTSMATPVVAGAIALWLQARPDLTPAEVKDVLSRTCRKPEAQLTYPNNLYGHGEIDVHRGLLYLLGIDKVEGISHETPRQVRAAISPGGVLTLRFASAPAAGFRLAVYSVGGKAVLDRNVAAPQGETVCIDVSPLPPGIYAVQISSSEPGMNGSLLVRR